MYYMGSTSPMGMAILRGEKGHPIVNYRGTLQSSVQKRLK